MVPKSWHIHDVGRVCTVRGGNVWKDEQREVEEIIMDMIIMSGF